MPDDLPRDLARSLAEGLHAASVRTMFGMPGGGPNLDMIGCAAELGIDFVLAHGETAACIMAATYGRLTGTPGVAIVTRGPGLTSAVNGLAHATLDRSPLLLISDSVPSASAGRVAHQRLDQVAATLPMTKWSGILGTADPVALVASAAAFAMQAPAGAVHLCFDPTLPGDELAPESDGGHPDPAALEQARVLLATARRPVVLLGLDAVRHADTVRAALAGLDCPMLVTYQAKGLIPESWPSFAGLFTGASMERPVLEQADVILAIGLDPVEPVPAQWRYPAAVVLVHSHPVETRYFGSPLTIFGPYREHLGPLVEAVRSQWSSGAGAEIRRRDLARLEVAPSASNELLTPHEVVRTTQEMTQATTLTVDAGAHMLVAMPLWQTDNADSVLISNGLATMGFSLPAAIAAALARPDDRVVCFVGDGGLAMTLAELETLARLRLPVTVVVFNDATLTLIKLKQGAGQGGAGAIGYRTVDFAGIATAMGVPGRVATDIDSLRAALTTGGAGPQLVDARVDPSGYAQVIEMTRG